MSSPAIMLRATEHGDYDKIISFFTLERGQLSLIAKGAKKSIKRFAGVLEAFSALNLVWTYGRKKALPVLMEASLIHPFEHIRTNITKTAYASYWCELVHAWMEEGQKQVSVYKLLEHVLDQLNAGRLSEETLHIIFQLRFMAINGFRPSLDHCILCENPLDQFDVVPVPFDVKRGGIICDKCARGIQGQPQLSKGTIKLLSWVLNTPLEKLHRVRFSTQAIGECINMFDSFVPYHLGKETKSSKFLKQLRTSLAD